jgi:hypothetical protein
MHFQHQTCNIFLNTHVKNEDAMSHMHLGIYMRKMKINDPTHPEGVVKMCWNQDQGHERAH